MSAASRLLGLHRVQLTVCHANPTDGEESEQLAKRDMVFDPDWIW